MKGRIFWAGSDPLIKGLKYYALASTHLSAKHPELDFRVAGIVDRKIRNLSECRNLHFLGRLSKEEMQDEFLQADMFVFPTFAEGLAGVVLESLAAGCPVVTTVCSGIDNMHSYNNGVIVPTGDFAAIADAIERLYLDRQLRQDISDASLTLASFYTLDAWRHRLMNILSGI